VAMIMIKRIGLRMAGCCDNDLELMHQNPKLISNSWNARSNLLL